MSYEPKRYEEFFFVTTFGTVEQDINDGAWWARLHIKSGNCFEHKSEALKAAKKFKKLLRGTLTAKNL